MGDIDPRLCSKCRNLRLQRSDFEKPPFEPKEKYHKVVLTDTLSALRSRASQCQLCRLFLHALEQNEREKPETLQDGSGGTKFKVSWMQNCFEYDPFDGVAEDQYGSGLYPTLQPPDSRSDYCVQLIDRSDTKEFLRARLIGPRISIPMICDWLNMCKAEHGSQCASNGLNTPDHPRAQCDAFTVIDVVNKCLCDLPNGSDYVALSYVWGHNNWPRSMQDNVIDWKLPGAFNKIQLPKTISDSMELSEELGYQYLWVDSLCIVQDSDMKLWFISIMDAVYGHAAVTIVAASGDGAHCGLSGWSDLDSREEACPHVTLASDFRLGVIPAFDAELMSSAHASRAWTFQEGCLSQRCLVFLNGLVYYSCRSSVWREDVHAELGQSVRPFEGANVLGRTLIEWPLRRFTQYVGAYTSRDLSFASDALHAFAGIKRAIASSMNNARFWYGVPASVFDWAMLFFAGRGEKLVRRQGFPSWSWVGWKGTIILAADHWSEFDQRWLLERTWIDWYIADDTGKLALVWDPKRDGTDLTNPLVKRGPDGQIIWEDVDEDEEGIDDNDGEDGEDGESFGFESNQCAPCPQYGHSPADPYGRIAHIDLPPNFPRRPAPNPPDPSSSYKPGTLWFTTLVATFQLGPRNSGPLHTADHSYNPSAAYFHLLDVNRKTCGIIWDHGILSDDWKSNEESRKVEINILSYAAPGQADTLKALHLDLADPYITPDSTSPGPGHQKILGSWYAWDLFNIMLAIPSGPGRYERVGAGLLFVNALTNAIDHSPSWKEILLY